MTHSKPPTDLYCRNFAIIRAMLIVLAILPAGCNKDEQQASKAPAVPAGLPSDLLAQRPDIQQAEQELIAANARIGLARAQYFPKISLTGDVGQVRTQVATLFVPGANFWSVGSALLTPIFTAGKIAGQVQSAEAVQKAAVANYQRSILSGFREFENALVSSNKTKVQKERQSKRVSAVQNYFNL